jgi:hypothetical protein
MPLNMEGDTVADRDLEELFKRAAQIAQVVPESMQEAAFHRALDALTGNDDRSAPKASPRQPPLRRGAERKDEPAAGDAVATLMSMERSRGPEIDDNEGSLAKGLALLQVARREFGIDGLTSQEIATVLTDKFRSRVTRQAINQAMDTAGRMVDRVKAGRRGSKIRIMKAGERWLELPAEERRSEGRSIGQAGSRRGRRASTHTKREGVVAEDGPLVKAEARRLSRSPKWAVESLIEAEWFATPRSLGDVRKELESRMAIRFKATDLSPALTRLLREKKLRRTKTEAGQYEYES